MILNGMDSGMMTGLILIDLQKGFDTIDQDILLQKEFMGFSTLTICWFRYLTNITFLVGPRLKTDGTYFSSHVRPLRIGFLGVYSFDYSDSFIIYF